MSAEFITLDVEVDRPMLRSALADAHLSQAQLAEKCGLDLAHLSLWINGKKSMGFERVKRIEDALEIPGAFIDRDHAIETASPEPAAAPEQPDLSSVLVVTPEAVEQVADDVKTESRAVIEDRAMQLFALGAVDRADYEKAMDELGAATSEVIVLKAQLAERDKQFDDATAALDEAVAELKRAKADLSALADELDVVAPIMGATPRLTAAEWLNARDEIAEKVKGAMGGLPLSTAPYAAAEALLGLDLINVAAALKDDTEDAA